MGNSIGGHGDDSCVVGALGDRPLKGSSGNGGRLPYKISWGESHPSFAAVADR